MSSAGPGPYPDVPASPRFPSIEEGVLDRWARDRTFLASLEVNPEGSDGSNEFVFYDGPPFANGLPHYGHLLTGFVKDAIPRYQTMRGHRVERRFGWDCHGLPAEIQAEKELGVSGRKTITAYGIDRFNDHCRTSVLRYTQEWERYVARQARWVDFENDYKTMDLSYMESVMWAFKRLHEKGLLYEAYRVLPYCWECETPLSNSETRQDDSYRDRQDPAVTVAFRLAAIAPAAGADAGITEGAGPGEDIRPEIVAGPISLWVWTTTPWTLPSNLALAVGADLAYAVFDLGDERIVIGEDRVSAYEVQLEGAVRVGTVRGAALLGRSYEPPFSFFASTPNAFVVLGAEWVTTDEGTGVVHMAPGFGEDDQITCAAAGIGIVCPVDDRTCFTSEVPDFEGLQVFEANQPVVRALRARELLVRLDSYVHAYPHCWRTDTPLVYRAVTSWFVEVTALKDRLIENNAAITWVPGHVKEGAFGKWLSGARDWSISRNRFWGSPIPVWKSDDPAYPRVDVYGSLDEIEADFGIRPDDLHRPAIDKLTRPNPDDPTGRSTMRRTAEVLDCWFESGSMPFAQVHYPFENVESFEEHFPGDFIVEYIGQTRAWFYVLHVMATALFDRPAFTTCVAHGIILGEDGQKMSKRLRNYPDPEEMFSRHGADAMRWYLLGSPVLRGGDFVVDEKGITAAVRAAVLPLWNTWYFFTLYANADDRTANFNATRSTNELDRYVLAKLAGVVASTTVAMDAYDLSGACAGIESFLEVVTNWYIRRSRDRFWGTAATGSDSDVQAAFDTLGRVLEVLCRLIAPLLPLTAESVWTGLVAGGDLGSSVHLAPWPDAVVAAGDDVLVSTMDQVREACSAAHSIRKAQGLRARLPLASLTVAAPGASLLEPFIDLISDEVNVKSVVLSNDVDRFAERSLSVVFKVAAPRLGAETPKVAAAAKTGDWELGPDGTAIVGGVTLQGSEFELKLRPLNETNCRTLSGGTGIVVLDTEADPDLEAEGTFRDVLRLVQRQRRDIGLDVAERISLSITSSREVIDALTTYSARLTEAALVVDLVLTFDASGLTSDEADSREEEQPAGDIAQDPGVVAGTVTLSLSDATPLTITIRRVS